MKKRLMLLWTVMAICLMSACGSKEEKTQESDKKLTESEMTTERVGENETEKLSVAGKEEESEESRKTDKEEQSGEVSQEKTRDESATQSSEENTQSPVTDGQEKNTQQQSTQKNTQQSTTAAQQSTQKNTQQSATAAQQSTQKDTQQKSTQKNTQSQTTAAQQPTTSQSGNTSQTTVTPDISPSQAAVTKADIIVASIINSSMDELQRVKAIHDYIVKNVNYDLAGLQNNKLNASVYTAEGALCNYLAVCQGYAEAFELLCAKAGIQAYMVYGEGISYNSAGQKESISHAWNVVRINNQWYQIDCTWDDPVVNNSVVTDGSNIRWDYFLLTDSEMYTDHIPNKSLSPNLKTCTSTTYLDYGGKLTLSAAMGEPSYIATNANDCYNKVKSFISSGKYHFYIAVPNTDTVDMDVLGSKIDEALKATGRGYSCSYQTSYGPVWKYVVYEIVLNITWQ